MFPLLRESCGINRIKLSDAGMRLWSHCWEIGSRSSRRRTMLGRRRRRSFRLVVRLRMIRLLCLGTRKRGISGREGFFYCPTMMICMPRQCSSPGEGFLTVSIWANIWSLARVYSTMPRQGARVAEWLQRIYQHEAHASSHRRSKCILYHTCHKDVACFQCEFVREPSAQTFE